MSNTSFHFTPHHARVSCLIIGLTINAITLTGWCWRLLIYALCNFLLHNNVMCFQKQPPLFLKVSQNPQENTCVGVSFFIEMMKLYKDICSASIKMDLNSGNVSCTNDAICWQMFFFNLHFRRMKCCSLYKFVIFTNQKPALKITTSQWSLTVAKTFVTIEKLCRTVTMTATA